MNRPGFFLVEVSITYIILCLAVAALVPMFIIGLKANKSTESIQKAAGLSVELLEEVRMRRWDENSPVPAAYVAAPSPTLGPDTGETATDKTTFDDIDDFHGWTENGVQDPLGQPLSAFAAYTRTVDVQYVAPDLTPSAVETDYKRISVCSKSPGIRPACLQTVVTNH